jgi:TatA/E family protein of Tat protein translocase
MKFADIAVLVVLFLVLFGPNKLPEIAKSMGTALNEFKKAASPDASNSQGQSAQQQATAPRAARPRRKRAAKATK